jgi:hypothetical protein
MDLTSVIKKIIENSQYSNMVDIGRSGYDLSSGRKTKQDIAKMASEQAPIMAGMVGGVSPAKRALVDNTGRKVLDQSGFIEDLVKRYESGASQVRPGAQVDMQLDGQARQIFQDIFKKKANAPVGNVIGQLNEALQGYRTEQAMKAGGQMKPAMQQVINSLRRN